MKDYKLRDLRASDQVVTEISSVSFIPIILGTMIRLIHRDLSLTRMLPTLDLRCVVF